MRSLNRTFVNAPDLTIALLITLVACISTHAQTKEKINLEDIIIEAQKPGYETVRIENKVIVCPIEYTATFADTVRLTRPLFIKDCDIEDNGFNFHLRAPYIRLDNIKAEFLIFWGSKIDTLDVSDLHGASDFGTMKSKIGFFKLSFDPDVASISLDTTEFLHPVSLSTNKPGGATALQITACAFDSALRVIGSYSNFRFEGNKMSSSMTLQDASFSNWITISDNSFEGLFEVSALTIAIPENVKFRFSQIQGKKLTSFETKLVEVGFGFLNPMPFKTNAAEYFFEDPHIAGWSTAGKKQLLARAGDSLYYHHNGFDDLLYTYQRFYNIYKARGDLTSMNECYVEMKNIQTNQFRYLYKESPSFNSFFRWRLSQMMQLYTEHGTDPAKAITISFWIIVLFGFFYIFFPSDWDVTSKSKLLSDFRVFIQKNEHGYFKPFLKMTGGLIISFINAVTLSLNAFTTLGFGNIPTHGLARYVCVLQGFIGWFLLSIFTVALINQVLT